MTTAILLLIYLCSLAWDESVNSKHGKVVKNLGAVRGVHEIGGWSKSYSLGLEDPLTVGLACCQCRCLCKEMYDGIGFHFMWFCSPYPILLYFKYSFLAGIMDMVVDPS